MSKVNLDTISKIIDRQFHKFISNSENMESAADSLVDDLIQDAIISVVFDVDVQRKTGLPIVPDDDVSFCQFEMPPYCAGDIFGNPAVKGPDSTCPVCNRTIAASRFAPHLAKCMGMGRNSSRIARTRIANNANKDTGGTSSCAVSDDEDDVDWTVMTEKKGKKRKEKTSVKKLKNSNKLKNGGGVSESSSSNFNNINYESMSERDRRALLTQICGVVSEHTKKVCTKTVKCPLHSDEQKKAVRDHFISESYDIGLDNLQIDVDTLEEEGETTKESLVRSWEAENSNTSSPADSASTSSSSASKKRDKSSLTLKSKD